MNKVKILGFIGLFIVLSVTYGVAKFNSGGAEVVKSLSFNDVDAKVETILETEQASDLLIVLDIDNTILTSSVDLGGDIWYMWQRGKLDIKPSEDQKVDCLFEDAIGLLYELNPMSPTDEIVPGMIEKWQNKGITVFALTSRSPKYRTATERELIRNGVDMTKTAIRPEGESLPVYREQLDREMSYMQGVMMTTGMNKGKMLNYILDKTGRTYKSILFVDDSEKNVKDLEEEFKNGPADMTIFHYDKIVEDRKAENGGPILTQEQADKMDADWKQLQNTLYSIFPARDLKEGCLGQ